MNGSVLAMSKNQIGSNEITLRAYDADISSYLKYTPASYDETHYLLVRWIDTGLKHCHKNGSIFEIGSGSGRDALYIQSKGYTITCSDASIGFMHYLRKLPLNTIQFNLLKDEVPKGHSMIFANAVFPHFTREETLSAITKIYDALPEGGIFSFNVKQGVGSLWTTEKLMHKRFMHFWRPEDIVSLVVKIGFEVVYKKTDAHGDLKTHTWTHLILKK